MTHKPKKSLGQNFLKSEIALKKLVEAGQVTKNDVILEIGPGKGAITRKLLKYAGTVVAVEKDPALIRVLEGKFAEDIQTRRLILIEDDILSFEILKFFSGYPAMQRHHSKNLESLRYKIIANIPYNITGAILKKFLAETVQPNLMVLLVQHEVAKRIVARDKKESILSISVKAYGNPPMNNLLDIEMVYAASSNLPSSTRGVAASSESSTTASTACATPSNSNSTRTL